jgi:hypothetical protein
MYVHITIQHFYAGQNQRQSNDIHYTYKHYLYDDDDCYTNILSLRSSGSALDESM